MKGHKQLIDFIEEIETNLKNDKYSHEQLKKLAEASPKIIEDCGKATIPFVGENGEKNIALENARIDVAKKSLEKFKNEGIEKIDHKALVGIVEFALDTLKTEIKYSSFYGEERNMATLTTEEKEEFVNRYEYFMKSIDIFFDVVEEINSEKNGVLKSIKKLLRNFSNR